MRAPSPSRLAAACPRHATAATTRKVVRALGHGRRCGHRHLLVSGMSFDRQVVGSRDRALEVLLEVEEGEGSIAAR